MIGAYQSANPLGQCGRQAHGVDIEFELKEPLSLPLTFPLFRNLYLFFSFVNKRYMPAKSGLRQGGCCSINDKTPLMALPLLPHLFCGFHSF